MLVRNCFFKLLIFLLFVNYSWAQGSQKEIKGLLLSAKDSLPLFGASVYFDGTSVGGSSNQDGMYKLTYDTSITSSLVLSSIGYETITINNYADYPDELPIIYLVEKPEELAPVYLEDDPWTRKRKLAVFRNEFLGKKESAIHCKIKNEDVLKLKYFPSSQTLIAYADSPIIVENKYLGYEIRYSLEEFEVVFRKNLSGLIMTYSVYYEGYSFFKDLKKKTKRKILKNRNNSYLGSSLHFMRSLAQGRLDQNSYKIFYQGWQVPAYKFFEVEKENELTKVKLLAEKVSILYGDVEQSELTAKGPFNIDLYGNHSPPNFIAFGGDISLNRVSELLPLNYGVK